MQWASLRRGQLDGIDRGTPVVLNMAATEQHGEHLPLGTDWMIGEAILERADQALGDRLLLLPTLRVGCSEHHMRFPGTLTLSHDTFRAWVNDVIGSAVRHGFKRFVLLNSHGGNQAIAAVLTEELGQRHGDAEFVVANWWTIAAMRLAELQEGPLGSVGHACEFETSIVEHLAPELVDRELAEDGGIQHRAPLMAQDLLHRAPAAAYRPFQAMTENGVFGMPSLANAEKGERVLAAATAALVELIGQFWPDFADKRSSETGLA